MEPVLITSAALKTILQGFPYDCSNFLPIQKDGTYAACPVGWFPKFVDWAKDHPLEPYSEESYDCDDMAGDRVADAGRAFRESPIKDAAPAFFWCELRIVPTSDYFGAKFEFDPNSHATCVCYADNGHCFIYEPQANAFADLGDLLDNHIVGELSFVGL